jgi:hypothetical protein
MVMGVHQERFRVKVIHGEKRLRTTALIKGNNKITELRTIL